MHFNLIYILLVNLQIYKSIRSRERIHAYNFGIYFENTYTVGYNYF